MLLSFEGLITVASNNHSSTSKCKQKLCCIV
jgi:hypothetical protein